MDSNRIKGFAENFETFLLRKSELDVTKPKSNYINIFSSLPKYMLFRIKQS